MGLLRLALGFISRLQRYCASRGGLSHELREEASGFVPAARKAAGFAVDSDDGVEPASDGASAVQAVADAPAPALAAATTMDDDQEFDAASNEAGSAERVERDDEPAEANDSMRAENSVRTEDSMRADDSMRDDEGDGSKRDEESANLQAEEIAALKSAYEVRLSNFETELRGVQAERDEALVEIEALRARLDAFVADGAPPMLPPTTERAADSVDAQPAADTEGGAASADVEELRGLLHAARLELDEQRRQVEAKAEPGQDFGVADDSSEAELKSQLDATRLERDAALRSLSSLREDVASQFAERSDGLSSLDEALHVEAEWRARLQGTEAERDAALHEIDTLRAAVALRGYKIHVHGEAGGPMGAGVARGAKVDGPDEGVEPESPSPRDLRESPLPPPTLLHQSPPNGTSTSRLPRQPATTTSAFLSPSSISAEVSPKGPLVSPSRTLGASGGGDAKSSKSKHNSASEDLARSPNGAVVVRARNDRTGGAHSRVPLRMPPPARMHKSQSLPVFGQPTLPVARIEAQPSARSTRHWEVSERPLLLRLPRSTSPSQPRARRPMAQPQAVSSAPSAGGVLHRKRAPLVSLRK